MLKHHRIAIIAGLALSAATGGCALRQQAPQLGPSPRAECAASHATLYFAQDSAELSPASTPIIRDVLAGIATCRAAGGELKGISVVGYPDRTSGRTEGNVEILARARMVRDALIAAGAAASAIRIERPRRDAVSAENVMQRRAEIAVDLW